MNLESIIAEIDAEIARLQQVKQLLGGEVALKRKPGRPPASAAVAKTPPKPKRTLSAAARAKIAAAQKKRWAAIKKTKAQSATAKKAATK